VSPDSRVIDRSRSSNIRSRNVDGINQMNNRIDRANSRFRTHSLDSRTNSGLNDRRTNSSLNRRRSVEQGVYNNPSRNSINRSIDRGNSSRTSGSGQYKPNRSSSSDAIRNRGNYGRSSTPSRSPGRSNFSSPSRSNNFSSPSRSNYSSPSRSNSYSPSRSSSPAPNRSSSIPSRPSRARSVR
jgi:hypothetical protein